MINKIYLAIVRIILLVIKAISLRRSKWKKVNYDITENKSLAIVRHGGIGDLLFVSSICKKIKAEYPCLKIILVTQRRYLGLFRGLRFIDLAIDYFYAPFWLIASDYLILLDGVVENDKEFNSNNIYDLISNKYASIALEDCEKKPIIYINEDCSSYVLDKIRDLSGSHNKVGIQICANTPTRTPSINLIKKIITQIYKKDPNCVVVIIADRKNANLCEFLLNSYACAGSRLIDFSSVSRRIEDLVSLITYLDFVVTPDSSVVHLAAALNVPSISLYGSFPSSLRTKYYTLNESFDSLLDCSPCFIHGHSPCDRASYDFAPCLDSIDMDTLMLSIDCKLGGINKLNSISDIDFSRFNHHECYIVGKGPSLDKYNLNELDGCTICLNDSYHALKFPDFVFYHDAVFIDCFLNNNRPGLKWVLPHWLNIENGSKIRCNNYLEMADADNVFLYHKYHICPECLSGEVVFNDKNVLSSVSGTLHSAIHFASKIGMKKINLIGIDGGAVAGVVYAKKISSNGSDIANDSQYPLIRSQAIILLNKLGIEYKFM